MDGANYNIWYPTLLLPSSTGYICYGLLRLPPSVSFAVACFSSFLCMKEVVSFNPNQHPGWEPWDTEWQVGIESNHGQPLQEEPEPTVYSAEAEVLWCTWKPAVHILWHLYALVCWSSSITGKATNRFNKVIKRAGSALDWTQWRCCWRAEFWPSSLQSCNTTPTLTIKQSVCCNAYWTAFELN